MIIALTVILILAVAVYLFFQQPQFGRRVSGEELKRIQNSPNYKSGQFQNLNITPQLTGDVNVMKVMKEFFLNKDKRSIPLAILPSGKAL